MHKAVYMRRLFIMFCSQWQVEFLDSALTSKVVCNEEPEMPGCVCRPALLYKGPAIVSRVRMASLHKLPVHPYPVLCQILS